MLLFVITAVILGLPSRVTAQRFSLSGETDFRFRNYSYGNDGADIDELCFEEELDLKLGSYLWDRDFFSYLTSFSLTNYDILRDSRSEDRFVLGYDFSGSLLPRNTFPITFYARRQNSDLRSSIVPSYQITTSSYGLNWSAFPQSLPHLGISLNQYNYTSTNPFQERDTREREASVNLLHRTQKNITSGEYKVEEFLNRMNDYRTLYNYFNIENHTEVTPSTNVFLFTQASRRESESEAGNEFSLNEVTSRANLYHHPSRRMTESLGIQFSRIFTDATSSTTNQLSYGIDRWVLEDLVLRGGLSFVDSRSDITTVRTRTTSERSLMGVEYQENYRRSLINPKYTLGLGFTQAEPGRDGSFHSHDMGLFLRTMRYRYIDMSSRLFYFLQRENSTAERDIDRWGVELDCGSRRRSPFSAHSRIRYEDTEERDEIISIHSRKFTAELISSYHYSRYLVLNYTLGYRLYRSGVNSWSIYNGPQATGTLFRSQLSSLRYQLIFQQNHTEVESSDARNIYRLDSLLKYEFREVVFSAEYRLFMERREAVRSVNQYIFFEVSRRFQTWF